MRGRILQVQALQKHGLSFYVLKKLIAEEKVRAWPGRRRRIFVSDSDCRRFARSHDSRQRANISAPPPADGKPVDFLVRTFDLTDPTIRRWCAWKIHPALGRKLGSGIGQYTITEKGGRERRCRGLLASENDFATCVDAIKHPLHRRFPGNPGVWIAKGIFQHDDGRLFFSDAYIAENSKAFGLNRGQLLSQQRYSKMVDALKVIWPTQGGYGQPWTSTVYSSESVQKVLDWREGKADGGHWLIRGELWQDSDGIWYSTKFIATQLAKSLTAIGQLRRKRRLTRYKTVPNGQHRRRHGGALVVVHHESEVRRLLGIGGPEASAPSNGHSLQEPESDGAAIEPAHVEAAVVVLPNDARAEWLYHQFCQREGGELVPQSVIKNRLRAKSAENGWNFTADITALKRLANTWAKHHRKPPIPKRQHGRRKKLGARN
jgi:hypothetical protein